jgi:hypothetical protein
MLEFNHRQTAHCETGAAVNLLGHYGIELSEPMAFGIAGGLTYAYLPFVKINGLPLIAYRMPPMTILRMLSWRIDGLSIKFKKFKNEKNAQNFLNEKLANNQPVGLQTSVYFLPYFPKEMRFHFNAHNLLVFDKDQDDYCVSDSIFDKIVTLPAQDLTKARFAKGALSPNGRAYYVDKVPDSIDFEKIIPKAIRFTAKMNHTRNFIPISGTLGINKMANRIDTLDKQSKKYQQLFLGHMVRMQEEIGTGGAGFRYMYAAFLQESAALLNRDELREYSAGFVAVGDKWREFALLCAQISKNRSQHELKDISQALREIANQEKQLYQQMAKFR